MTEPKRATRSGRGGRRKSRTRPLDDKQQTPDEPFKSATTAATPGESGAMEAAAALPDMVTEKSPSTSGNGSNGDVVDVIQEKPPQATQPHTPSQPSPVLQPPARHATSHGPRREEGSDRVRFSDELTGFVYYDKSVRGFVSGCVEFPSLRGSGRTREEALQDLDSRVGSQVQRLRSRNEALPEGIFQKQYPERIEIRVSQGLYRRLDLLSRAEKVPLDQLLTEILTAGVSNRSEHMSSRQAQPPHQHRPQAAEPRHQHQQRQSHQHSRRLGGRSYHDTMDNRENFLEYVRSLEKGGGWKKR